MGAWGIAGLILGVAGAIASVIFLPPLGIVYTVAIVVGGPSIGAALGIGVGLAHDYLAEGNEEDIESTNELREEEGQGTRIDQDEDELYQDDFTDQSKVESVAESESEPEPESESENQDDPKFDFQSLFYDSHRETTVDEFSSDSKGLTIDGILKLAKERQESVEGFKKGLINHDERDKHFKLNHITDLNEVNTRLRNNASERIKEEVENLCLQGLTGSESFKQEASLNKQKESILSLIAQNKEYLSTDIEGEIGKIFNTTLRKNEANRQQFKIEFEKSVNQKIEKFRSMPLVNGNKLEDEFIGTLGNITNESSYTSSYLKKEETDSIVKEATTKLKALYDEKYLNYYNNQAIKELEGFAKPRIIKISEQKICDQKEVTAALDEIAKKASKIVENSRSNTMLSPAARATINITVEKTRDELIAQVKSAALKREFQDLSETRLRRSERTFSFTDSITKFFKRISPQPRPETVPVTRKDFKAVPPLSRNSSSFSAMIGRQNKQKQESVKLTKLSSDTQKVTLS